MIETKRSGVLALAAWGLMALVGPREGAAAIFENLYTVTIPLSFEVVEGEQPLTEEEYVRLAMGQLLTRVTGRADAFLNPVLADLVRDAGQFVIQRGYPDRETLLVTFDARAVETALVQRNQPIWGAERPLTLVWVAIDAGFGERTILSAEPPDVAPSDELVAIEEELREQLQAAATERGLPITLPLWDLQDMASLDFIDVWGGFGERVRRASERYAADAVLSGRIRVTNQGFEAQWTLLRGPGQVLLPGRLVRSGLDQLADLFAGEFSTIGSGLTTLITVIDVDTLEDYGRVMRYMEGLSVLDTVDVEDFSGPKLTLRVAGRGGPAVLERVLTLSDVLTRLPAMGDDPTALTFALSQ